MPEAFPKKTALVVSGGGSKGAFAVGAIEHLMVDRGLRFDIVAGTSTGSLIAPLVVTGDIDRLRQVYTSIETSDVLTPNPFAEAFLRFDGLFNSDPSRTLISRDLTDARTQQIFNSDTQMFITTVNMNTGKTVFFQTGRTRAINNDPPFRSRLVHIATRDELIRAIMGSVSEPVFMPPVTVNPNPQSGAFAPMADADATIKPTDRYVDGGVRDIAPIKIAIDNRATDIYAIVLSSRDRRRNDDPYTDLLTILARTVGLFTQEIAYKDVFIASLFNKGAQYRQAVIEEMEKVLTTAQIDAIFDAASARVTDPLAGTQVVNLFVIRPEENLAGTSLDFDPGVMAQRLLLGRERAEQVLNNPPNVFPPPAGP